MPLALAPHQLFSVRPVPPIYHPIPHGHACFSSRQRPYHNTNHYLRRLPRMQISCESSALQDHLLPPSLERTPQGSTFRPSTSLPFLRCYQEQSSPSLPVRQHLRHMFRASGDFSAAASSVPASHWLRVF